MPKAGSIAFISQSGALCTSVLDWALEQGIGFSLLRLGRQHARRGLRRPDRLPGRGREDPLDPALRRVADRRAQVPERRAGLRPGKPIVAYKAGRFPESAKAAASHTGALASEDEVFDAAFARAGVVRVYEIADIFNSPELVGRYRSPAGPRLGIVTNAGGPGVMATDALIARRGVLAELAPGDDRGAGREPAARLVARQPRGRAGRRQLQALRQGRRDRGGRPGRGRGARDPHAPGHDQPDRDRDGAGRRWRRR